MIHIIILNIFTENSIIFKYSELTFNMLLDMKRKDIDIPTCVHCKNSNGKGLLCCLPESDKQLLSENKCHRYYKKGEVIFLEGNHANGIFCLYKGKVKLVKLGKEGKEQIVRLSKEGDILGYRSLLSADVYQATAVALDDSYICHISKDIFLQTIKSNPTLSFEIIQLLSSDLKNAEQHLINFTQKTVKERISEAILLLASTFGYLIDGKTINIKMNRSEIAEMASTTTESAIRTLSALQEEGMISLNGKYIVIHNMKELIKSTHVND